MEFEAIYREYFRTVELYLLSLCKDEDLAEELTAQVFYQAMGSLSKFRGDCDIFTWLCAIGKNAYLSHVRKQRSSISIDEVCMADTAENIEQRVMDKEQAKLVHKALHQLPQPYKEVFSLRVFGQLPFADIGALFGMSQNWACVTYHRARQKIKDALEGLG